MKMEQTECSETSAYKIKMQGNYSEESIQQHSYSWEDNIKVVMKVFIETTWKRNDLAHS